MVKTIEEYYDRYYSDYAITDLIDIIYSRDEEIEALKEDISDLHEQIRYIQNENSSYDDLYF